MKPVCTSRFSAYFERVNPEGVHERVKAVSTMELFLPPKDMRSGFIAWDIPALNQYEEINVWWDSRKRLMFFDGVFCFPPQAVSVLEGYGVTGGRAFVRADNRALNSTFRLTGY